MKIVEEKITIEELQEMTAKMFGDLVKAVVDLNKKILVVDADLHSDQEALLLEQGSQQEDLWGINIYPKRDRHEMIEFDSMINIRPSQGNNSRSIEDPSIQKQIIEIVNSKIS